jgi:prevent-host-death family protein
MAAAHDSPTEIASGEIRDGEIKEETMAASEFKAHCLAVLDRVAASGLPLVVTKRGRPVVRVVPLAVAGGPPDLLGSVRYEREEDLLAPVGDEWEAER